MSTPEYRTPHTVASTNRTLRNAFSALNMHYSGDEEESESDGSPRFQKVNTSQPEYGSSHYNNPHQATQDNIMPATQVVANQAQPVPIGDFMPMDEFARPITTLPANVGVDNRHREFDAQSIYPGDACLFVANLPQHVDDLTLRVSLTKHFGKFGTVFVKVKRDRIRHMPMAFVQYTQIKHADVAVREARGDMIHGRAIRVEKCGGNLSYIIWRKDTRPVLEKEALSIFSRYGPVKKVEILDYDAQTKLAVPPSLRILYSRFDPKRNVIQDVGPNTPFVIMAFDPKMVQKRSDRPADDQTFMEIYEKDCRSVFFGGLPHYADEAMVYRLAGICGHIRSVDLRTSPDQDGGLPHPWAFVEYDEFDVPDRAMEEFNGKEVEGCILRVERKRTKPAPEAVAVPQAIGTRLPDSGLHHPNHGFHFPDSGLHFPNTGPSRIHMSGSSRMPGSTDDARMYPSPLRPVKRPHGRFNSRIVSAAATPDHRRMVSSTGLSQEEQEFLEHHRLEDLLRPETVQPRLQAIPTLAVPAPSLDSVTPVHSPEKHESGNAVRFAPSPSTLPSHAGSSPIPLQIPAPPAEFSPPNLRAFKDRLAADAQSRVTAFSPAAELAARRCEVAAEDKANGKGHRRAVSMFITSTYPPPLDLSESDDSTWRESGSSPDEQGTRKKKKAKSYLIRRRHLSEENLKRNLLYQSKLKGTYASEEILRGRTLTRETDEAREKSGKSRKSDATERAKEGQVVVASQQAPEGQLVVAAQQQIYQPAMPYAHMVPQYPPTMPPMGYIPMPPSAMAPAAAPGGFTYMDVPQHPHLQVHEQMQMYPGTSHLGYAGPGRSQVQYAAPPHAAPMYQGQPQVPFQGHHQREYHEPMTVSQDARNHPYQSHGRPQYQGRRHASYAHPQQMHYQGNYSGMPHSNFTPRGPRESFHQSRQRQEAERYRRYNS
ncbi:meiotic activator RIM4 [Fusarium tjaetaba]|uniref:Meiotic activator RIM4 n=1 Tax=Fusarium tjaetaba TaxID=1567544 RepID=A0A8H5SFR4_9HYPO|nr:meiotic activator RIM4 [Fusarium tjaetaba]KAF5649927.1 meiotic activator RIM4 [Fusarium tjaetaba]